MTIIIYRNDRMDCIAAAWVMQSTTPGASLLGVAGQDLIFTHSAYRERAIIIGPCYSPGELAKIYAAGKGLTPIETSIGSDEVIDLLDLWEQHHKGAQAPWLLEYVQDIGMEQLDLPSAYEVAHYLWSFVTEPEHLQMVQMEGFAQSVALGNGCIVHSVHVAQNHSKHWYSATIGDRMVTVLNTTPELARDAMEHIMSSGDHELVIAWHVADVKRVWVKMRSTGDSEFESYVAQFFDGDAVTGYFVAKDSETFKMLLGVKSA